MALNLKETSEDVSNNYAAVKSASVKNKRVASKWQQFAKAIETQKSAKSLELSENRSKLLSQREETRTRTVSFANKKSSDEKSSSFQSVCDVLLASIRAENTKPEAKTRTGFQRPTRSSEKKKLARKNISISLGDIQKSAQITTPRQRVAEQRTAAHETSQDANSPPRHQRPKSAFDFTEEEELYSRKLYSSPPSLPRIHLQKSFRPKSRTFDRDVEFQKRISVDENLWKDVHHYRYLRISPLRRSQTAPDLKQVLRS